MIRINNVTKSIEGASVLNGVDMHINKGSIYGLVGPNGAGKSTIIRCVAGAYRIDSGEILMEAEKVYESPDVKTRIAYVPDDVFYHIGDNITSLMKFYKGVYKSFDADKFEELLTKFPTLEKKKLLRSYSKGMQRQVAVLFALCTKPDLMLLDEPLDGLDPMMRRQVLRLIMDDVADRQTTVLISSHNLRELEDICDCVGIMKEGRIVLEKPLSELQDAMSMTLEEIFIHEIGGGDDVF